MENERKGRLITGASRELDKALVNAVIAKGDTATELGTDVLRRTRGKQAKCSADLDAGEDVCDRTALHAVA